MDSIERKTIQTKHFDFRHAKKVYEQNTREKILSGEKQAVATVSVSPLISNAVILKQSNIS